MMVKVAGRKVPNFMFLGFFVCAVVTIDQLSKLWAVAVLENSQSWQLFSGTPLSGLLGLTFYRNPGAALSFGSQSTFSVTLTAIAISLIVVWVFRKTTSLWWLSAAGLILGGALGNLIDRFFRYPSAARGYVVDFIGLGNWAVVNLADVAITSAAVLMVALAIFDVKTNPAAPPTDSPTKHPLPPTAPQN